MSKFSFFVWKGLIVSGTQGTDRQTMSLYSVVLAGQVKEKVSCRVADCARYIVYVTIMTISQSI